MIPRWSTLARGLSPPSDVQFEALGATILWRSAQQGADLSSKRQRRQVLLATGVWPHPGRLGVTSTSVCRGLRRAEAATAPSGGDFLDLEGLRASPSLCPLRCKASKTRKSRTYRSHS